MGYGIKVIDKTEDKSKVILKGAYLYYSKHTGYGAPEYDAVQDKSLLDNDKPWMHREYAVDVLVTKAVYKELKKIAKKMGVREVEADKFEEAYGVAAPFEADEYFLIKATKMAYYKKTEEPSPAISVVGRTRDEDLKETEVGNGSLGNVILRTRDWTFGNTKGTSLDLSTIQVMNLIPYEAKGNDLDDLDFEDDDLDDLDDDVVIVGDSNTDTSSDDSGDPWD